jgi:hypothetical protein
MSLLFITAGTKGGIGKTLTATLLTDFALFKESPVVLYDCDNENESLKKAYIHPPKNCRVELVKMDCNEADMDYPLDFIVNDIAQTESASKGEAQNVYIVDMKAGTSHYTLDWLKAFPFDFIRGQGIGIHIVGCVTADLDSVYTLSRWVAYFIKDIKEEKLRFLIVKNTFLGENFVSYDQTLGSSLETESGTNMVIELPDFGCRCMKKVKDSHTSLGQIAMGMTKAGNFSLMDESRIKDAFDEIKKLLEPVWRTPTVENKES